MHGPWRKTGLLVLLACACALVATGCGPRRVRLDGREVTVDEAARSRLEAARAKERAGEHAEAAKQFEEIALAYPDADEADEALFGAGQAHEAGGEKDRARSAYQRLVEKYPSSDKAALARARAAALGGKEDEALEAAKEAYGQLPEAEKHVAATKLAEKAEVEGRGREAYHWRVEALERAPTMADRKAAQEALLRVIDARLSFLDISRLADEVDDASPAAPLVRFKLVKILLHLRDYERLERALADFTSRHGSHPYATEARALLDKIKKRGTVDPLKIGVVLPMSGKYKAFGDQVLAGVKLALEGSKVQLALQDDKGEPADAGAAVEALVYEEHVVAIIGGVLTAEAQAVTLRSAELGIPVITFSRTEGITKLGELVFRDMLTSSQMSSALLDFAMGSRGVKKFAILHPELPYGEELREDFRLGVEQRGGQVQAVASYKQDETTFSDTIKKLVKRYEPQAGGAYQECLAAARAVENTLRRKNAIERCKQHLAPVTDFQALFLPDKWQNVALVSAGLAFEDVITNWCDDKDIERIEKTTSKKIKPVMLLGANLWNHPDLPMRAGKYVNCSVFVDGFYLNSSRPETQKFVQTFWQAHGKNPGLLEAYGYDAALALRAVIESRSPASRKLLADFLLQVKDLPSAMGPTTVTPERELVHPLYFLTVDRGAIREADPAKKDGPP